MDKEMTKAELRD